MNVAICYTHDDEDQFVRWLGWVRELGAGKGHRLTVLPFKGLTCPAITGWDEVTVLRDYSGVESDWSGGAAIRDAAGPNHAFREMARHFSSIKAPYWMWMEPDAIPLTADAFTQVEREYVALGRRFLGANVQQGGTMRHMSGIAVYPGDLTTCANYMLPRLATVGGRTVEAAFNLAGAPDAFQSFAATRLIQQEFKPPAFATNADAQALIDNGRVIFHHDKSGSLIELLRLGAAASAPAKSGDGGFASFVPSLTPPPQPAHEDLLARIAELEARVKQYQARERMAKARAAIGKKKKK